ncbi:MAG: YihY/virulence factor BrkB family protein [Deltaproteobacteria bacterium]|nr:YihY/virulence factor BrkB family protein [Deltaproteobacteria bacterium]
MAFRDTLTRADPSDDRPAAAVAARSFVAVARALRTAATRFYADGCPTLAAAISFYALLSLIPVLFLVIAVAGYVIGSSQDTYGAVLRWVREFIPHLSDDFTRNLEWVVQNRGRLSWLGLGALVIAASLVFQAIEFALDRVFTVGRRRGFWRSRLLSLCVVVGMGLVMLFSFYVGLLIHALRADPTLAPLGHDLLVPLARGLRVQYLTSVALVVGAFTLSLRVFPHAYVGWREAFTGGCIGAGLWEVGRRIFLWYLANLAQFYVVYGSLGALVAVMVWIYMSATIFLYAAEVVVALQRAEHAAAA